MRGFQAWQVHALLGYMGGCQNYGPFLDPYYNTAPNIQGTQKGTIILTSTHMRCGYLGCSQNYGPFMATGDTTAASIWGYQNRTLVLGTTHLLVGRQSYYMSCREYLGSLCDCFCVAVNVWVVALDCFLG